MTRMQVTVGHRPKTPLSGWLMMPGTLQFRRRRSVGEREDKVCMQMHDVLAGGRIM